MEGTDQIRRAARYMDGIKPDWWAQIDPLTLNMVSSKTCVCGQNDLSWEEHTLGFAAAEGKDIKSIGDRGCPEVFAASHLTALWLEEIAQRMPPARIPAGDRASETEMAHAALA